MGICQTKINNNLTQKASLQDTMVAIKSSPVHQQIKKSQSTSIQRQSIVSLKCKVIPKYHGSVFKNYSIFPKDSHLNSIYRAFQVQHNLTGQFRLSLIIEKHSHHGMQFYKKLKKAYLVFIHNIKDHPNICKIYEIYKDQTQYHIITEYCQGCHLGTFAMRTLTEEEIKRIMQQIIQAVIYLHSLQLKCKLTLQSFYFLNESDELTLKFTDFLSLFGNLETTHEQVLYQSPEECQQEPKSNLASDAWSIGVIFFRLLSGYLPIQKQRDIDRTRLSIRRANINFDSLDLEKRNKRGVKLMKHLLRGENKQRVFLIKALQDSYFLNGSDLKNKTFIQNALDNIKNQNKKANIVQLMIFQFMIKQFGSDMQQKLFDTFSAFDTNKDGKLSKEEVKQIYLTLFKELDPNEHIERIFKVADLDQSGDIDLNEFVLATFDKNCIINKKNLDLTFKLLDQNNSGKISIKELSEKLDIDHIQTSQIIMEFLKKLAEKQGKEKYHKNFFVLDDFKIFMFQII